MGIYDDSFFIDTGFKAVEEMTADIVSVEEVVGYEGKGKQLQVNIANAKAIKPAGADLTAMEKLWYPIKHGKGSAFHNVCAYWVAAGLELPLDTQPGAKTVNIEPFRKVVLAKPITGVHFVKKQTYVGNPEKNLSDGYALVPVAAAQSAEKPAVKPTVKPAVKAGIAVVTEAPATTKADTLVIPDGALEELVKLAAGKTPSGFGLAARMNKTVREANLTGAAKDGTLLTALLAAKLVEEKDGKLVVV